MSRRLLAAAVTLAVLVGGTAAAGAAPPAKDKAPVVASKAKAAKPAPKPKTVVTVYPGTVVGVRADSLTVTIEVVGGRDKAVRQTVRTFAVPASAKVTRDGVVATLADVQPGDHADVKTAKTGTGPEVVTAVNATSPVVEEPPVEEPPVEEPPVEQPPAG